MTPPLRRTLLAVTAFLGLYVGGWSAFAPQSFYDSFPGLGFIWISIDGAYNEHLIRDVGTLNLGLAAATIFAAFLRGEAALAASRTVGIAWVVFSVPHLAYHLQHLDGLGPVDVAAQILSVASTGVLGVLLMLDDAKARIRRDGRSTSSAPPRSG